jgi:hypothetical protein
MPTACVDATTVTAQPEKETLSIQTTLYDLIASINAKIVPQNDHQVIAEVLHLLNSGRVTFLRH